MNRQASLIEQAARRLEELKRVGVRLPQLEGEAGGRRRVDDPALASDDGNDVARPGVVVGKSDDTRLQGRAAAASAQRRSGADRSAAVNIDLERLGRMGYLTAGHERTALASEFRLIKRPLLRNVERESGAGGNRSALIMITSAVSGEGKTFCAINLALSIAMEVDTSVLLVDADVVRPALLDRLGLPFRPGLLELLSGDVRDVSDVLLRTNIPKLSILPAGAPTAMATELLASAAMDELLVDLATRYPDRVVVLDTPPLLLTTESPVLASMVGQVVIVVDSSKTNTQKVAQAFATVESCPIVLSLLNKCREPAAAESYGYTQAAG